MFLYRVEPSSKPTFEEGHEITPTRNYSEYLKQGEREAGFKRNIENTLTGSYSCPGIDRQSLLFLFHELKDAFAFSSKIHKGRARIYTVQPNGTSLDRRDMNVLDVLNKAINQYEWNKCACGHQCINDICDIYWKNHHTFSPCLEYTVNSAQVINLVSNEDVCRQFHNEFNMNGARSVERCPTYVKTLSELSELPEFAGESAEEALKLLRQFKHD